MALVSNIQLQNGAVKPPNLDTNLKYTAAGLTATEAIAVGTVPVSTSGAITVKSANDIRNWIQTTKTDGNVEIYMSNDARPDWALRVAGTADNAFVIANSYGSNCTAQFPAFSIGGAGAVGIGKTGATNTLDIAYKNAATGGIQILQTQNNVGAKLIAESTSASIGSTSNHKFGFRVNGTTVAAFNTSTQFGIGTDSPGATLDVRGAAIFNEAGAAVDFRIEGDAEQNLFFVDGSADAIGMGTATPVDTSRLHVMGTDGDAAATHSGDAMLIVENCGTTFLELATGNGNHAGLTFSDAAAATRGAVLYDHGTGLGGLADTLMFQAAGSIGMVLDSGGEVGIGTLQPSSMLHVVGGSDAAIRLQGSDTGSPALNFYQGTTCRGTIMYKDTGDNFVMDSDGKVTLQTSSTPRLVITNAGCVGIGTNAVASGCGAELDIFSAGASTGLMLRSGNSSAASATIIGEGYRANGDSEQVLQVVGRNRNAGIDLGIFEVAVESLHCLGALELKTFDGSSMTTKMKITSGGNVGVGTATPAGKFHVEGSCAVFNPVSANAGKLEIVQGSTHADSIRLNATGTVNMYLEYRGYNGHVFVVDSTEEMRLTSTGLGIGTTAPTEVLDVTGAVKATAAANNWGYSASFLDRSGCAARLVAGATSGNSSEIQFWTYCAGTQAQKMIIKQDGHVGIGTAVICDNGVGSKVLGIHGTTGHGTLHLTTTSSGTTNADGFILSQCNTDAFLINRESGHMYLRTADTNRLTIDSSGLVAIGSTSPSSYSTSADDFVVAKDAANVGMTIRTNSTGTGRILFANCESSTANNGVIAYNNSTGEFTFDNYASGRHYTFNLSNSEIMRIDGTGVGIGTTAPANKLHVHDTTNDNGINMLQLFHDRGASNVCQLDLHYIKFMQRTNNAAGTVQARIAQVLESQVHSSRASGLAFYTENAGTVTEKLRINNSGNVGIATTSPNARLSIQANSSNEGMELQTPSSGSFQIGVHNVAGSAGTAIQFRRGGSDGFDTLSAVIDASGCFGIGTDTPGHTIQAFSSADDAVIEVASSASNGNPAFRLKNDAQEWQWQLRGAEADSLVAWDVTGGAGRLYLTTAGNLGLGTTCPTSRVMVEGTGTTTLNSCSKWISIGAGSACSYTANNVYGIGFGYTNTSNMESAAFFGYKVTNAAASGAGRLLFATRISTNGSCAPTERATILDDGKFGIGTTVPVKQLMVSGPANNCEVLRVANIAGTSGDTQGITYIGLSPWSDSSTHAHTRIGVIEASDASYQAHMIFETRSTDGDNIPAERVRITNSGLVGIGTNNPSNQLHVKSSGFNAAIIEGGIQTFFYADTAFWGYGDATAYGGNLWGGHKSNCYLNAYTNGSERLRITSSGLVGIGTTPGYPLHVARPAGSTCTLLNLQSCTNSSESDRVQLAFSSQTALDSATRINAAINSRTHSVTSSHYGDLEFLTMNAASLTQKMVIKHNGYVGIGTTAPRSHLNVYGDSTTAVTFGVDNASGSSTFDISALGASYNAHGVTACNVWFYSPDDINIGGATSNCNDVRFISNGALNMTIDGETRNVGIGTVPLGTVFWEGSISSKLQVSTTGGDASVTVIRNHSLYGPTLILARNGGDIGTNTLANAGESVGGINYQANDGSKYVQVASINATLGSTASASCMSGLLTLNTAAPSNGSVLERMRITEIGMVGIGTAAPAVQLYYGGAGGLHVQGSIGTAGYMVTQNGIYIGQAPNATNESVRIDDSSNGGGSSALFIGNAQISVSSDRRVKNNIQCYTCSAVDVLDNARVVEFEYDREKMNDKSDFGPSSRGKYVGLIAQEMIEYARWAINDGEGDPEGEHIWKAEYEHMVPLLIKAVQELNERVAELEAAA